MRFESSGALTSPWGVAAGAPSLTVGKDSLPSLNGETYLLMFLSEKRASWPCGVPRAGATAGSSVRTPKKRLVFRAAAPR